MNKKLLRKKLALMLANLKKKRKYYTEVEFLESTGTQWIDTGLKGKNNLDFDYKAVFTNVTTSTGYGIGGEWQNGNSFYLGLIRSNGTFAYHYGNTASPVVVLNSVSANTPYVIKGHMWTGEQYMVINGTKSSVGTVSGTFTATENIALFRVTSSNPIYSYTKIYYLKIWDNGVLVRDMIPVLDWNMKPCMYDRVTEQLFYNAGTGDFIAGREIHPVEYLESTGTQYINTGLLSTARSTVDTAFSFTSMESGVANNIGVFGGRNNTTSNTFTFFKIASTTPQFFRFDYNGQTTVGTASEMTWDTASKYRFQYNGTNCTTTNTTTGESVVTARSPASTFTTSPICLFAVNTSGTVGQYLIGRIYYYKYSDGTNSVDMVPAIDSNGTAFMFDRVSHTCFLNQGTGAFKYPAREVEYLEGTGTQCIDTGLDYFADFEIGIQLRNSVSNKALGNGAVYCMQRQNSASPNWQFTNGSGNFYNSTIRITEHHVMKWKDNKVYSDDVLLTEFTKNNNAPNRMYLYSADGVNKYPNVIDFCKLWNPSDGTLVRDFVPAIKDGVLGMHDKINEVFYPNAGTGDFLTGKIVEPEYE